MSVTKVQAKDIPTAEFLHLVDALRYADLGFSSPGPHWVTRWDVERYFRQFPERVVHAKFKNLVGRKMLQGCTCGCRGDIELTAYGESVIACNELAPEVVARINGYAKDLEAKRA